jgi:hypothetical protein
VFKPSSDVDVRLRSLFMFFSFAGGGSVCTGTVLEYFPEGWGEVTG